MKKRLCAVLAAVLLGTTGCAGDAEPAASPTPLDISTPPPNTMPSSIMIDDVLYYETGLVLPIDPEESEFEGRTTSAALASRMPTRNDQANWLPEGTPYLYFSGTVRMRDQDNGEQVYDYPRRNTYHDEEREGYAVMMPNGEWRLFEQREPD